MAKVCVQVGNIPTQQAVDAVERFLLAACEHLPAHPVSITVKLRKTQRLNTFTAQHRGRAVVQFGAADAAQQAAVALAGLEFAGQQLTAEWTTLQPPKGPAAPRDQPAAEAALQAAAKGESQRRQHHSQEKAAQARRRIDRQLQQLQVLLDALPPPAGLASLTAVPPLADAVPPQLLSLPWEQLPCSCHPAALMGGRGSSAAAGSAAAAAQLRGLGVDTSVGLPLPPVGQPQPPVGHGRQPEGASGSWVVAEGLGEEVAHVDGQTAAATGEAVVLAGSGLDARVARKCWQVESFAAVLRLLLPPREGERRGTTTWPLHIVDFGCGSGNLLLPLAVLFPHCRFTGVDMKPAALQVLQRRAQEAGLANVTTWCGMIQDFPHPFQVALALHACGNATDHALLLAQRHRAAYLVSPCCVGKLKFSLQGGSSFSAAHQTYTPHLPALLAQQSASPIGAVPSSLRQQQQQWEEQQEEEQEEHNQEGQHQAHQEQEQHISQQQQQHQAEHHRAHQEQQEQHVGQPHQQQQQQQQQEPGQRQEQEGKVGALVVEHPRSQWLRNCMPDPVKSFRLVAQVADVSHAPSSELAACTRAGHHGQLARAAKVAIEADRNEAAREAGYHVGLFLVLHAERMAKGDLLVGVPPGAGSCQEHAVRQLRLS